MRPMKANLSAVMAPIKLAGAITIRGQENRQQILAILRQAVKQAEAEMG